MAKIVEHTLQVKITRVYRDKETVVEIDFADEFTENLESIIAEMIGDEHAIVEVSTDVD